jgi:Queuosine biosynthesis protein QueC
MTEQKRKAVVLLSGGLDSTTVLAIANAEGYENYALSFSYGQRHSWELECACSVASALGAKEHRVASIDLRAIGGSALTADISVPKGRTADEMSKDIPITYVPARNTIFLSFALAWAEVLECNDIFIGVNALDYSGYPRSSRRALARVGLPTSSQSISRTLSHKKAIRGSVENAASTRSRASSTNMPFASSERSTMASATVCRSWILFRKESTSDSRYPLGSSKCNIARNSFSR